MNAPRYVSTTLCIYGRLPVDAIAMLYARCQVKTWMRFRAHHRFHHSNRSRKPAAPDIQYHNLMLSLRRSMP